MASGYNTIKTRFKETFGSFPRALAWIKIEN